MHGIAPARPTSMPQQLHESQRRPASADSSAASALGHGAEEAPSVAIRAGAELPRVLKVHARIRLNLANFGQTRSDIVLPPTKNAQRTLDGRVWICCVSYAGVIFFRIRAISGVSARTIVHVNQLRAPGSRFVDLVEWGVRGQVSWPPLRLHAMGGSANPPGGSPEPIGSSTARFHRPHAGRADAAFGGHQPCLGRLAGVALPGPHIHCCRAPVAQ